MKLIYSLLLVAVLSACNTTVSPDGTRTTSVDNKAVRVIGGVVKDGVKTGLDATERYEQIKSDEADRKAATKKK